MAGSGSEGEEWTLQPLTAHQIGGLVSARDHRLVAGVPSVFQDCRSVSPKAERKHVVEGEGKEIGTQEIAARQGFEAIAPIVDFFSPPQHKRRLRARMIPAVLLCIECRGYHDGSDGAA